jgi:hypothetical protein
MWDKKPPMPNRHALKEEAATLDVAEAAVDGKRQRRNKIEYSH